jgi:hypothetical protein
METQLRPALRARKSARGEQVVKDMWVMVTFGLWPVPVNRCNPEAHCRSPIKVLAFSWAVTLYGPWIIHTARK